MRYMAILAGMILAAGGAATALAADIYTWTDKDGNVHYADVPAGEYPVRLDIESRPTDPQRIRDLNQARTDARIRAEEAQAAANGDLPTDEERKAEAEDRARKCELYKANLDTYLTNRRLYNLTSSGEREYLSADEMTAAREKAANQVTEFCS